MAVFVKVNCLIYLCRERLTEKSQYAFCTNNY
jgi:hypothetical protein